ncbi:DNA-binding transcriptional regulator, AcrR family [Raineyella antarctica]|uniref:DNA-binding transcriptional regulator, AcrR family n=1 Tax=Raineyella antarctica TaxID=1577474 RepID=A0A1G6HT05_9ACTN|nr:TetR family transcriptional regulator [Raineyella antarctica]SDB97283.1 DNA-binding transcriptional regulator, AcrR family [Raineyella antarctica]
MTGEIKGSARRSRPYDASRRQHAAQRRRDQVVDAAGVRFRRDGYAATTVADVAADAGVSVEFVYKAFGSKAGLVRAIWDRALLGQGRRPAEERSDEVSRTAEDPEDILANWARLSAEVSALGAPVQALIKAAAVTDDGAAALLEEVEAARRARMEHNADYLLRGGFVRPELTPDQVRDILMLGAGELYEIVVLRYGWSAEAYVDLVHRFLRAELLPDPTRPAP